MRSSCLALFVILLSACGASSPPAEDTSTEEMTAADPTQLLAVGTPAPDFIAPDETGTDRTLQGFRGHTVVLYFYPRDATPGCTAEACAFREAWDEFSDRGVPILGVSVDDVESHRAFQVEHQLPFPLLADTDHAITDAYGARGGDENQIYSRRVTYLIDGEGVIRQVFADVDPGVHATEVLAAIDAMNPPD